MEEQCECKFTKGRGDKANRRGGGRKLGEKQTNEEEEEKEVRTIWKS